MDGFSLVNCSPRFYINCTGTEEAVACKFLLHGLWISSTVITAPVAAHHRQPDATVCRILLTVRACLFCTRKVPFAAASAEGVVTTTFRGRASDRNPPSPASSLSACCRFLAPTVVSEMQRRARQITEKPQKQHLVSSSYCNPATTTALKHHTVHTTTSHPAAQTPQPLNHTTAHTLITHAHLTNPFIVIHISSNHTAPPCCISKITSFPNTYPPFHPNLLSSFNQQPLKIFSLSPTSSLQYTNPAVAFCQNLPASHF